MKTKLIRITTVPLSLHLLIKGQPKYMQKHGFEVKLVSSNDSEINQIEFETGLKVKTLPVTRRITPILDLKALWLAYKYFRLEKPMIVHTHTPKAGFIGMLASKFAGVPIRMHTVAGLPLLEAEGFKRRILNLVERLTSLSATNIYPNSFSLKDIMINEKLANKKKLKVIGNGSSNGIDTKNFSRKHFSKEDIVRKKELLGIEKEDVVFTFVGRIVKDKGVNELLEAFDCLSKTNGKCKLLMVGSQENDLDPLNQNSLKILKLNKRIIQVGWQEDVRSFLAISDVFVFPSYREGFPNVVMQSGAMELPCIATNINGSNEIIKEGFNGLIIPVKDVESLKNSMNVLIKDAEKRILFAQNSRQRIIDNYEQTYVWDCLLNEYIKLLDEKDIKHQITN